MIYNGILNKISNLIESSNIFVGKNLFDKDAITEGKSLDVNGVPTDASGFYCSDFIEVNGGRQISITKVVTATKVSVYNENREHLSQHINEKTFVLEGNAAYIRIGSSVEHTPPSTQQIEYGDIATEYEPYQHVGLNDVINKNTDSIVHVEKYLKAFGIKKSLSRNIFNPADGDLMTGYYLNASGTPVSLGEGVTTGWVSGYMFVMPKSHYTTNLRITSNSQYMAFYTIDKKLITTKTTNSTYRGFDTPDDCYFVRTTINKNESVGINGCQIELGIISTPVRSFYENESAEEEAMLNYEGNLIDVNNKSAWLQGSFNLSLVFTSSSDNYKTTDYIRVKGGQYYLFNYTLASATKPIIFFNAKKEVVESASAISYVNSNLGFIKIPDSAVYMMVSVDINSKFIIFKNTFYNDIQHKEAKWYYGDIEKETDKYVSQKFINLAGANLCAYYDGMFILISSNQKTLYVGRDLNTIFVSRTEINITDLIPDATSDVPFVYNTAYIFKNTRQSFSSNTNTYVFIVTTETKVFYYSYAVGDNFSPSFTESNVLIGLTEPIPQMQTDFVKDGKHGLKILPNNDPNGGTRLQYFKALNSKLDIYANGRTFVLGSYTGASVSTGTNKPYEGSPTCLYTTTDGIDFTVAYMFGFSGARYRMAGGDIKPYARFKFGEDMDTSLFGQYGGGLKMKVRLNVVPSSNDINPTTSFEYLEEVDITSATNAEKGVFTLSDASNVQLGDCVCITGSATGSWAELVNSTASATSGGNGVFFMVTSKNGNNVTLATCVGNPHNPLFCTHCHAVNSAWNGVILSTGEEYPDSWLIFVEISYPSFFPNYRINSSEKGMSRSCGVVVRPDNKFIYAADTATGVNENFIGQVTGRTDKLKISPLGIWKFDMADVDDHSKYTLVHGDVFSIYGLCRLNGNVLYAAAQGGEALISFDNGDSFEKISNMYDQLAVYLGSEHNKTFIFGGQIPGRKQTLIVRLK